MWAWFLVFSGEALAKHNRSNSNFASLLTFAVIGIGALGCWLGGVLSDRWGRTKTAALMMAISRSCALLVGPAAGRATMASHRRLPGLGSHRGGRLCPVLNNRHRGCRTVICGDSPHRAARHRLQPHRCHHLAGSAGCRHVGLEVGCSINVRCNDRGSGRRPVGRALTAPSWSGTAGFETTTSASRTLLEWSCVDSGGLKRLVDGTPDRCVPARIASGVR
jgi:hypothetical protein